ncbi:MAG: ABC transporter substrate-binding protein [Bacteroidales bacterium]|nr:ABC transporter substrate-binding protein [Bacteroidales bacterium]
MKIKGLQHCAAIIFIIFLSLFIGCANKEKNDINIEGKTDSLHYAKGFKITRYDDYTHISVINPWDTTQILHEYILIPEGHKSDIPATGQVTFISVPLQSVAILGVVHAGMLEQLNVTDRITGAADVQYMNFPFIHNGLEKGTITDLGSSSQINIEKLMESSPGALFVTSFPSSDYGKLEKTGIPFIECVEYMENTPLGRAEWIKFMGAFLGKSREADSIYNEIEKSYIDAAVTAQTAQCRPTVFSEKKYGGAWNVPGGESYMAVFFRDAGADYIWKEDEHTGSLALSFEEVYTEAENADFWIIKYFDPQKDMVYNDIKAEYDPYSLFGAWQKKHIVGCNTANVPYYERGTMQPHIILKDFIKIFHPELLPEYQTVYFKPLP